MIASIFLVLTLLTVIIYGFKLLTNNGNIGIILIMISSFCILVIIFPEIGLFLAKFFGVARGTDLLLFFSFIMGIIFALVLHVKIRNLDKVITDLTRHIALSDAERKKQ